MPLAAPPLALDAVIAVTDDRRLCLVVEGLERATDLRQVELCDADRRLSLHLTGGKRVTLPEPVAETISKAAAGRDSIEIILLKDGRPRSPVADSCPFAVV